MKQVVQNYKSGDLSVIDVPTPRASKRGVLVRNRASAVSVGTDRLIMDMAQKSLLGKARARPDLVKQVIAKVRTDGIRETYRTVTSRLDSLLPLGNSSAGVVEEVMGDAGGLAVGDFVACFGTGYASHAEFVSVPRNLCVKVPNGIDPRHAAFAGVGAIALHSVRLGRPEIGMNVAVIGLGLLGQMTIQMLQSSGARVFGIDVDETRVDLARSLGASEGGTTSDPSLNDRLLAMTNGAGADIVYILASTPSNDPIELAAELAADGGRLVAPGMVGLDVPRRPFYDKELDLIVSRSTGPGMYDQTYTDRGVDYPRDQVRWTSGRNAAHFLEMLASEQVRLDPLLTHSFDIENAEEAYELLNSGKDPALGVVLTYPKDAPLVKRVSLRTGETRSAPRDAVRLGLIGAGLWAKNTLLPTIHGMSSVTPVGIATAGGVNAVHSGEKFGFDYATADYRELINDPDIDAIMIATRHDSHAAIAIDALKDGKDVFVEKPPAMNPADLNDLIEAQSESGRLLMAGFNRRFAPLTLRATELLGNEGPFTIVCRVNAGPVPGESWVQNSEIGGGRIVGEVCHFVDLLQHLAGSPPVRVHAEGFSAESPNIDNLIANLSFSNGSVGTIVYAATGDKAFAKERIEIIGSGAVCVIDDFRSLEFSRGGKRKNSGKKGVDRGHSAELRAFFDAIQSGSEPPISMAEIALTMSATFAINESLSTRQPVDIRIDVPDA